MKYDRKCPECAVVTDFEPVGPYRARCTACGGIVKNEELEAVDPKGNT